MSSIVTADAVRSAGRVLIIEDNDTMRQLETISFQRAGWVVTEAGTGREGLAAAAETQPEVIICDRRLPDLDGIEVIAALVRDPATAAIPVVMVTGMGETDDVVAGIDAGAHDYVVKPFKMIELDVRCRAALRVTRQHRLLVRSEYELHILNERKRADEVRLQLAAIVESSNDAIFSKTLDGIILSWNTAAQRLYGYTAEEIVGKSVSLLVPPDRPQEVADILAKLRRGEAVEHFETSRVHKNGHLVPVSLTISPIRDASGHLAAASSIARDITDRKRADEVRLQLAAIVESSNDAIFSKTLDGIILSWNTAAQRLYGYTAEEIVGKSVSLLVPPDRPQEVADILAKLRRGEAVEHFETSRVHKNGHLVPVSLTISPVRDASGHLAAASSVARDITDRNRQRHLERIVLRDALTGLGNRSAMDEDRPGIQDRFDRYRHGFCIAMLDIDHFKSFNDSLGHQTGDRILAEVSAAITLEIRPGDLAYRYGGDEFLIIYPNQTLATTSIAVQRIRHRVEKMASHTDFPVPVTLSVGVAEAGDGERYDTIVRRADRALYQAKHDGRNLVCLEPHQSTPGSESRPGRVL